MTETRTAYNVAMQPGPELDALVARVMRNKLSYIPDYSTRISPAMQAWTWLEEKNPWICYSSGDEADLLLGRFDDYKAVYIMGRFWESSPRAIDKAEEYIEANYVVTGQTYPHAIALAVVEAGKVLGVIDIDIKP